jgi:RNA polymerase sigma-70 factor (ECF subfamily)
MPSDSDLRDAQAAAAGDRSAWESIVDRYRPRLRRMVALRLDRRMGARVDPSDVVQEALLDASLQLESYLANPVLPLYLWLRMVTGGRLGKTHRFHLGTQRRDLDLEIRLNGPACPGMSSQSLADVILAREQPPAAPLEQDERADRVRAAVDGLSPADREIIGLRHFEHLGLDDVARVLELTKAAAAKRYVRAMARLRAALPGEFDSESP